MAIRVFPTTSLDPPNHRCQKPWLMTTWPVPPPGSSSMVKVVPRTRIHTQGLEQVGCHERDAGLLRLVPARDGEQVRPTSNGGQGLDGFGLVPIVHIIRKGDPRVHIPAERCPPKNQFPCIGERQSPTHGSVGYRKHGRGGADTQGQGEEGHDREGRGSEEPPDGVPGVEGQIGESVSSAYLFFHLSFLSAFGCCCSQNVDGGFGPEAKNARETPLGPGVKRSAAKMVGDVLAETLSKLGWEDPEEELHQAPRSGVHAFPPSSTMASSAQRTSSRSR